MPFIRYKFRLYLLALLIMAGFSVLLFRLWGIQITQYNEIRNEVPGTSTVSVRIPGTRGEIRDRNGVVLASNKPNFQIIFDLKRISDYFSEGKKNGEFEDIPGHVYETYYKSRLVKREERDIVRVVDEVVLKKLESMGLARPFNTEHMRVHFRTNKGLVPYIYRRDLDFTEFALLAEQNLNLPGVRVEARPMREYVYDALASHVLGYVKLPDEQKILGELREKAQGTGKEAEKAQAELDITYFVGDDFGVDGVEMTMDEELQGKPGRRTLLKDEKGQIVREVEYIEPQAGKDVYLTLDVRIQMIAEQALHKVGRGAAVVLDPKSGEILAMASVPSFNPNKFIPTIKKEEWKRYRSDPTNPLVNRSLKDYAPGSTFKIPVAFAGALSGIDGRNQYCSGGVVYGSKKIHCWIGKKGGSHGSIGLTESLMRSCNSFYFLYANQSGIDTVVTACTLFGLGQRSGIELLGEDSGRVPNPKWLRVHQPRSKWSSALTALVAIGQGATEATPLQMASVVATVANGGKNYKPRLIHKIADPQKGNEAVPTAPELRHDLLQEGIKKYQMDKVRKGLHDVVNELGGTARRARIEGVIVAGKTGTAQFKRSGEVDNHAWFVSFAPYEDPTVAVCVFVQGGESGGAVAAPISSRIIEETLALETSTIEFPVYAMAEAKGHFDLIKEVKFEESPFLEANSEEEVETDLLVDVSDVAPEIVTPRAIPKPTAVEAPVFQEEADMVVRKPEVVRPAKKFIRKTDGEGDGQ